MSHVQSEPSPAAPEGTRHWLELSRYRLHLQRAYLRKRKKCCTTAGESEICERNSAEGGQEMLQVWSRSFLKCRRGPQWSMGSVLLHLSCCTVLLQPMEHHTEQTSMCSHKGAQSSSRCDLEKATVHGDLLQEQPGDRAVSVSPVTVTGK